MNNQDCPFGKELQKYWDRRYDLFSRFDDGIQIDKEGLYSAMPENAVIDGMCGLGGLSIALAQAGKKVTAVDLNPTRLVMAEHNAAIYGVADKITFLSDDILKTNYSGEAIFFDPPWGGPDYSSKEKMVNADFAPDMSALLDFAICNNITPYFLAPKNYDLNELKNFGKGFSLQKHHMWGKQIFSVIRLSL